MARFASHIVLTVTPANAEAILNGKRAVDVRRFPPRRLPARAYLAVAGTGAITGECVLGEPVGTGPDGTLLPISNPRAYRHPKSLESVGLARVPRSFRYVDGERALQARSSRKGRAAERAKAREVRDPGVLGAPAAR